MKKYNNISSKMYKHLIQQKVQQKVQQKMRNNYVSLLIKRFLFVKLVNLSTNIVNTQLKM